MVKQPVGGRIHRLAADLIFAAQGFVCFHGLAGPGKRLGGSGRSFLVVISNVREFYGLDFLEIEFIVLVLFLAWKKYEFFFLFKLY